MLSFPNKCIHPRLFSSCLFVLLNTKQMMGNANVSNVNCCKLNIRVQLRSLVTGSTFSPETPRQYSSLGIRISKESTPLRVFLSTDVHEGVIVYGLKEHIFGESRVLFIIKIMNSVWP